MNPGYKENGGGGYGPEDLEVESYIWVGGLSTPSSNPPPPNIIKF